MLCRSSGHTADRRPVEEGSHGDLAEIHRNESRSHVLPPGRYLEMLRTEVDAFADVVRRGDLGSPVPSCPGWDLTALIAHLGSIHRWARHCVSDAPQPVSVPGPGSDRAVWVSWFTSGADTLIDTLAAADPDTSCRTFGPPGTVRFWLRRQALETTVHRWDAQATGGQPAPIEPDVAADGLHEVQEVFVPRQLALGRLRAQPGVLRLAATDVPGSVVDIVASGAPAGQGQSPTATASGPAAILFLVLWKRTPPGTPLLYLSGDRTEAHRILTAPLTP